MKELRLIPRLLRAYPGPSATVIALLLFAGLAEGLGIGAVMPLLSAVTGSPASVDIELNAAVYRIFGAVGLEPNIENLVGAIVVVMALKAGLVLLAMRHVAHAMASVSRSLRTDLLDALLRARWKYFTRQPIGRLANAVTTESITAGAAFWAAANVCTVSLQVLIYLGLASLVSLRLTFAAAVAGSFLFIVLHFLIRMTRRAGKETVAAYNSLLQRLVDGMTGIKAIKAMGQEDRLAPMLDSDNQSLFQAQRRFMLSKEAMTALQEPLAVILLAGGLLAIARFWPSPLESIVMMALLFQRTVSRLGRVQSALQQLAGAHDAYQSLERKIADAEAARETHAGRLPVRLERAVEFHDVSFAHDGQPVLANVSLRIPAGRLIAIYGVSGSGKTTMADLIAGLYKAQSGTILVDDEPLEEIDLKSWRKSIGYVPQELFLFHDTVRNNVTLGDSSLAPAAVERALADAGAADFVSRLVEGLDTMVGERGSALSGGQRQRIALARALARGPSLLILDEPTTALDPQSEAEICKTLRALSGRVTIVAISHQRAIVDIADVVYQVENGRARQMPRPIAAAE